MVNAISDFQLFLRAFGSSKHTIRAYTSDLNQLADYCSKLFKRKKYLEQITKNILRNFFNSLYEKDVSFPSISRKISTIKSFFDFCKKNGLNSVDPAKDIAYPKKSLKLPKFFTIAEMFELIDLPDTKTDFGIRDKAMLELLYATGMRIGELEKVEVNDYDPARTLVKISGKGGDQRLNPVGSYARRAIKKYLKIRPKFLPKDDNLFLSKSGRCLKADCIREILQKYIEMIARCPGYSVHSIRHSFATHLLENGCDLRALQIMMGHKNLSTTQLYIHLSNPFLMKTYIENHPRCGKSTKH